MAKKIFYGDVPKKIKSATRWYMKKFNVSLGDAFQWACRTFASKGTELYDAWYYDDFASLFLVSMKRNILTLRNIHLGTKEFKGI